MKKSKVITDSEKERDLLNFFWEQIPIILKDDPRYKEIMSSNFSFSMETPIFEDTTAEEYANKWLDEAYSAFIFWNGVKNEAKKYYKRDILS